MESGRSSQGGDKAQSSLQRGISNGLRKEKLLREMGMIVLRGRATRAAIGAGSALQATEGLLVPLERGANRAGGRIDRELGTGLGGAKVPAVSSAGGRVGEAVCGFP